MSVQRYGLKQTVAPTVEPLTTEEAKAWLRVQHAKDDTIIADLIKDARERFERVSGFQALQATYQLTLDAFPGERDDVLMCGIADGWRIYLPGPRCLSVTSIVYIATDGTSTTLPAADYSVDTASEPARIEPSYAAGAWPSSREQQNAVTVTYQAGYGAAAAAVPSSVKTAIKRVLALLYEHRGVDKDTEAVEVAIEGLFRPFWHGRLF